MKRRLKMVHPMKLTPPLGWERRIDPALVRRIAASIPQEGIREPIICVSSREGILILHGVHRWAAAMLAEIDEVEVILESKSKSPEEHRAKVIVENLERQHLPPKDLNDLRLELEAQRAEELGDKPATPAASRPAPTGAAGPLRGRKKSSRGEAREEVAKKTGTTKAAIKEAARRRKKKSQKKPNDLPESNARDLNAPAQVSDARGVEIPPELAGRWADVTARLKEVRSLCRQIAKQVKPMLADDSLGGLRGALQAIAADSKAISGRALTVAPEIVCRSCSGSGCVWCSRLGFENRRQAKRDPHD